MYRRCSEPVCEGCCGAAAATWFSDWGLGFKSYGLWCWVQGSSIRVLVSGSRVQRFGLRILGLGLMVWGAGSVCKVQGLGSRVQGVVFRVEGSGFMVYV